jgi:hypothetical protein
MPPPPVGGAAVGIGRGDGLGDGDRLAEDRAGGLAGEVAGAGEVAEGPALRVGVLVGVVPLRAAVAVAEGLLTGEDEDVGGVVADEVDGIGSVAGGEDDEQAETAAETSTVAMPQPTAVHLVLAAVVRGLTGRLMRPAGGRPVSGPCIRRAIEIRPIGDADMQWRVHH